MKTLISLISGVGFICLSQFAAAASLPNIKMGGPLPHLCQIVALSAVEGVEDPAQGLDWPNVFDPNLTNCDETDIHARMAAGRTDMTEILIEHLHQATYRNPLEAITDLAWKGFVGPKRDDIPPVPLTFPIDWQRESFDRNWRFNLNSWKMVEPMFAWHAKSGEILPLKMALDLIKDWTQFNLIEGRENDFNWYDIAAGQRAMKVAYLLDRVYRGIFPATDEEKTLLLQVGHIHVEALLDPGFINPGNHGTFQIHGLAAMCRTAPMLRLCRTADRYIAEQMDMLVRGQYGEEALHMEHSSEYHFFMYKVFERMFSTGWYDDLEVTKSVLARAEKNKKWLIFPSGEVVRHGDTDERQEPLSPDLLSASPARCAEPAAYDLDCFQLKTFPKTGYASVRSAWNTPAEEASMVFLMASYHSHAHKQRDHLSVELFERGLPILVDSGKFAYDKSNPKRQYVQSTRAHNTVEIDGGDYVRSKRHAIGSALKRAQQTDWGYSIQAGMTHVETNTQHTRSIAYRPGRWLAVTDMLASDKSRRFEQWFHLHETLQAKMKTDAYIIDLPDGSRVRALTKGSGADCTLRRARGQTEPRLQGWISREYRSFYPNDAIGYACTGTRVAMTTLFVIEDPANPADIGFDVLERSEMSWQVRDGRDGVTVALFGDGPAVKLKKKVANVVPETPAETVKAAEPVNSTTKPARLQTTNWPDRSAELEDGSVVGLAVRQANGTYNGDLSDLVFTVPGNGWFKLDEVQVGFSLNEEGPAAFAVVCRDRLDRPCQMAGVGADGKGARIGKGQFDGALSRYYDQGAFARGRLEVRKENGRSGLMGEVTLTSSAGSSVRQQTMTVALELVPLDAPVVPRNLWAETQCGSEDPVPLFDELAKDRYTMRTFAEVAEAGADPEKVTVLLRHDVDRSTQAMVDLARLQQARGLKASYFFNLASGYAGTMTLDGRYRFNSGIIEPLLTLQYDGHEVGYHTDALFMDLFHDLRIDGWLGKTLDRMRKSGLKIVSEASNGSPYRRLLNAHNRFSYSDFRSGGRLVHLVSQHHQALAGFTGEIDAEVQGRRIKRTLPDISLADVGLRHAAYYPETYGVDRKGYRYLTDTKLSAADLVKEVRASKPGSVVQVLMHPWRWRRCPADVFTPAQSN